MNGDRICANTTCDHLLVADTSNFGAYALIASIIVELIPIYRADKDKFLDMFPPFLQVIFENIKNEEDLIQILQTHIGVWVSSEKQCSDLMIKFNIRDGILKQAGDTVDGISFDEQARIIKELQDVITDLAK